MKLQQMIHRISFWEKAGIAFLLLLPFFASCTHEEELGDGNGNGNGIVHINGKIVTRSYVPEDDNKELINDWFIIVADGSDQIVEVLGNTPGSAVEEDEFTLALSAGTYTFYSFANITKEKVRTLAGYSTIGYLDVIGNDVSALNSAVYNITSDFANGTQIGSLANIPMSGKITATLAADGQIELEVIRMLAKIEMIFRNASTKDITLHNLTFKPLHEGKIKLLPDYTTLLYNSETDPIILSEATEKTVGVTVDFPSSTVVDKNSYSDDTKKKTMCFYLRESVAKNHPTGHFMINLNIDRDGVSEPLLFTLSDEAFTGINRNDYWQIPIKFTNYVVKLKVISYPPIGGYPATYTSNEEEFYCKFSTQGGFAIMPTVYDNAAGAYLSYPAAYEYEMTGFTNIDGNIFSVNPHMEPSTGEILGELNTTTGKACIKVKVTVDLGGGVSQVYERRIYIIRE